MKLLIPPPLVALVFALAMWGLTRTLPPVDWLQPMVRNVLATFSLIAALVIDGSAILAFRRHRTTVNPLSPGKASAIVRDGPYRFSRNPMYLGMALILFAVACRLGQPLNVLLIAGFVGYITVFQIKPEETMLLEKFGNDYADYLSAVRRWL